MNGLLEQYLHSDASTKRHLTVFGINKRARAADKDPDFSRLIREELPKGD
jgi:hypothetical protein